MVFISVLGKRLVLHFRTKNEDALEFFPSSVFLCICFDFTGMSACVSVSESWPCGV